MNGVSLVKSHLTHSEVGMRNAVRLQALKYIMQTDRKPLPSKNQLFQTKHSAKDDSANFRRRQTKD